MFHEPPTRKKTKIKQPPYWMTAIKCRRRPIFPGSFPPSIFGTSELNYRVRNGNGWTLIVINTDCENVYRVSRECYYYTTAKGKSQAFFRLFLHAGAKAPARDVILIPME